MLGDFASHADEFGEDAIGLVIRRELTQLKELIERSKQIYVPLGAIFHVQEKMWRFPNGARLSFAYIDNDADADRYMGGSYSRIYVEELGNFPSSAPIFKLMACIRSPNPKVRCGFRATGNPGGPGHCVPFGEVMTPNGWKPIEEMKIGDPVYTVSNSGHLFTSSVEQVHTSRYIGDMVHVSARGLSVVCTPNHRVAKLGGEKKDRDKKFSLVPFCKLPGQATILRSVEWEGKPIGIVDVERFPTRKRKLSQPTSLNGVQYAALVGWMVSEGCTIDREKAFAICQLKPRGRAKIVELLDECGFSYMTQETTFTCYAADWWNHFRKLGKCRQKYIPEIVKNATKTELRAFFEAAMMGDGHWDTDASGAYYTISKALSDDMSEVAIKLGYIVYVSQRQRKDRDGLSYEVSFKKKKSGGTEILTGNHIYDVLTETKRRSDIAVKPFDGTVHCIGVPVTHNFVIRQNGSVWISGNSWIKQRYIMPAPGGMKVIKSKMVNPFTKEEYELERVFIPSKITDNRYNNTPAYVARLQMVGNARLVDAWLQGNWDIIEGAYFDEWDERRHIIPQFIIPAHWTRYTSMDWGSARPSAVLWWAVVPDKFEPMAEHLPSSFDPRYTYKNNLPRGAIVCYREWYTCQIDENGVSMHNNVGQKLTAEQFASGVAERERREPQGENGRPRIAYRVADPSIFKEDGGPSLAERFAADPYFHFWRPADNARVARKGAMGGWDMVRARLIGEDGEPMIYFFPNCVDTIRTLPALQHDKDNIEDVETDNVEDHCFTGETLVKTLRGMYPLAELVGSEGFTRSHDGKWHPYRSVRLVGRNQRIVRLKFSDGTKIRCTPDHKFLTANGWMRAESLVGSTILSLSPQRSKSSTERGITSVVAGIIGTRGNCFTVQCGKKTVGRSQTTEKSTIRIAIGTITALKILIACWATITALANTAQKMLSGLGRTWQRVLRLRKNGTEALRALLGTVNTIVSIVPRPCIEESQTSASIVAPNTAPTTTIFFAPINANLHGAESQESITRSGIVRNAAKSLKSADIVASRLVRETAEEKRWPICLAVADAGRDDVYCLTVPETGNFELANGMIVANCADSARYSCTSRPYSRPEGGPEKGRIMTVGPSNELQIKDVMGDFEAKKDTKFVPYKRI